MSSLKRSSKVGRRIHRERPQVWIVIRFLTCSVIWIEEFKIFKHYRLLYENLIWVICKEKEFTARITSTVWSSGEEEGLYSACSWLQLQESEVAKVEAESIESKSRWIPFPYDSKSCWGDLSVLSTIFHIV